MCYNWAYPEHYLAQAVGVELDLMVLFGGAGERAAIQYCSEISVMQQSE
jgi:hypothetical protein